MNKLDQLLKGAGIVTALVFTACASYPAALANAETASNGTQTTTRLSGGVVEQDPPDLIGTWNVRIRRLRRTPKVVIEKVEETKIVGTYVGLLGRFPLWGEYDAASGAVHLFIDFSGSRILHRMLKGADVAEMTGELSSSGMSGTGSMPELPDRQVDWQAQKEIASQ